MSVAKKENEKSKGGPDWNHYEKQFFTFISDNETLCQAIVLFLVYVIAFAGRLYSVLRYESVIHEFDPYFNFRTTKYLVNEGFYNFHNWFDCESWYPLGRIVGGTIYPGLMVTAAFVYWTLQFLHFTVDIRNVCVLLAPWMSSNTCMAAYLLTKEVAGARAGLIAAALLAGVPGYISRSVAGSYDNEGVAIFALLFCFYLWVKSVKTGSMFWSAMTALAYFYMVSAWGGYIFIINIIPIHVLFLLLCGRYSHRVYVAYCTFYTLGIILSMQIPFVGFHPVRSSEHMAAFGMFGLLQLYCGLNWIRSLLSKKQQQKIMNLFIGLLCLLVAIIVTLRLFGYVSSWTGRFYSLLDPTYAKAHIPIIASVSEHQPTTWANYYWDLQFLVFMLPAGFYFLFKNLSDGGIFLIVYGVFSVYFSGVMVRLMLVLAPAACMISAVAISLTYDTFMDIIALHLKTERDENNSDEKSTSKKQKKQKKTETTPFPKYVAVGIVTGLTVLLVLYVRHCTWVTSEAYSSPSIVLHVRGAQGRIVFDDFREAYYWMRHNTPEDAKIMSWWDYGYQIAAMANRTIIVDNNTWNNTHIATVGKAMASTEEVAYPIMQSLDVDYVLIFFGGLVGYSSDDINKFLWMVRIGGGVYPEIVEKDYFDEQGQFRVDSKASKAMLESMMYKLCYYRFGQIVTEQGRPSGFDRVRKVEIGNKDFELEYLEEAFTSEHWLVRIYKVNKEDNRP